MTLPNEILPLQNISIVVAVSDNWVIGKNGDMPWGRGLKDDLKNFRINFASSILAKKWV